MKYNYTVNAEDIKVLKEHYAKKCDVLSDIVTSECKDEKLNELYDHYEEAAMYWDMAYSESLGEVDLEKEMSGVK